MRRLVPLVVFVPLLVASAASAATFTSPTTIGAGDASYDGEDILVDGTTLTVSGFHVFKACNS